MISVANITDEPYCVYGHFSEGVCFYIGSGHMKRAFEFVRDRGKDHIAKMRQCVMSVTIFNRFAERKDALEAEKSMIMLFKPECNKHFQNRVTPSAIRLSQSKKRREERNAVRAQKAREKRVALHPHINPIKCIETGQFFYGNHHAGRKMNLCPSRISANVLGKCRSVDQYHFVRTTWEISGLDRSLIARPKLQP